MSPTFSVIVPTYHGLAYLDQAIQSVLDQTDPDWECWILDDASTDATEARAAWWAHQDDRIHTLHHTTQQGVLAARNHAILASQGVWIKPLDQDDRLHPEALAHIRQAVSAYPEAVIVSLTAQAIDHQGLPVGRYTWLTQNMVWTGNAFLTANLLGFNPAWVPTCHAYRRDAWAAVGGYRDPGRGLRHRDWGTDWELLWRISTQGSVVTLATVAVDYRVHANQVSQQRFGQAEIAMRAWLLTKFFADYPDLPTWIPRLAWGKHASASWLLALTAWQHDDEASAGYALDQWMTFPGPFAWEQGAVQTDVEAWQHAIQHHRLPRQLTAWAKSRTLTLIEQTGWSINPATVEHLLEAPDTPVHGTADLLAPLAAVWPTLNLHVVASEALDPSASAPGVFVLPPGPSGAMWAAHQPNIHEPSLPLTV